MHVSNWQNTVTTIAAVLFTALAAFGILSPEQETTLTTTLTTVIGAVGSVIALIASFRKDEGDKKEKEGLKAEIQTLRRA